MDFIWFSFLIEITTPLFSSPAIGEGETRRWN
jgi:hypothetical protein